MKVLQINCVCGVCSTGRICTDIATILEEQGHSSKVAYGCLSVPEQYKKYAHAMANPISIRVDARMVRLFDNNGFNSVLMTKRFVRWMKKYDPDIVHLHNIHGSYINVGILFRALKEMGKPVIWTLHDCWSFTGRCHHFARVGCEKWKDGCKNCTQAAGFPARLLWNRAHENYEKKKASFTGVKNLTVVTPSKWLADLARQSFLNEYDIRVIPNGIDLGVFKPTEGTFREEHGLQDKKIVLSVASSWGKDKGLPDLYRLADLLGDAYQVVIVGLSREQVANTPANILGIARTNNVQELAHIYTTADIFVNPTYQDTYPTVNLESQSCGTPVITYRTGGSVESVPEGQIVEPGDVEALCQAIKEANPLAVLNADFSAKTCFEKYILLYNEKQASR